MKKLLPCPFCGSPATTYNDGEDYVVTCTNSACEIIPAVVHKPTVTAAIATWNTVMSQATPLGPGCGKPFDLASLARRVTEHIAREVDTYEHRGDTGDYHPTEQERLLMADFAQGIWFDIYEMIEQLLAEHQASYKLDIIAAIRFGESMNDEGEWQPAQAVKEPGWYWMDFKMPTPIFPCFWTGQRWENSSGIEIKVQQFYPDGAEILGPIQPCVQAERDRNQATIATMEARE